MDVWTALSGNTSVKNNKATSKVASDGFNISYNSMVDDEAKYKSLLDDIVESGKKRSDKYDLAMNAVDTYQEAFAAGGEPIMNIAPALKWVDYATGSNLAQFAPKSGDMDERIGLIYKLQEQKDKLALQKEEDNLKLKELALKTKQESDKTRFENMIKAQMLNIKMGDQALKKYDIDVGARVAELKAQKKEAKPLERFHQENLLGYVKGFNDFREVHDLVSKNHQLFGMFNAMKGKLPPELAQSYTEVKDRMTFFIKKIATSYEKRITDKDMEQWTAIIGGQAFDPAQLIARFDYYSGLFAKDYLQYTDFLNQTPSYQEAVRNYELTTTGMKKYLEAHSIPSESGVKQYAEEKSERQRINKDRATAEKSKEELANKAAKDKAKVEKIKAEAAKLNPSEKEDWVTKVKKDADEAAPFTPKNEPLKTNIKKLLGF